MSNKKNYVDEMVLAVQQWVNSEYSGKNGFNEIEADGRTGWNTIGALITALQIEEGISEPNGVFGPRTAAICPTISINSNSGDAKISRIIKIIQGALYCKGYDPNGFDGSFGNGVKSAIQRLESDAGLLNPKGVVTPMIFKALLTMEAFILLTGGDENIRKIQQNLNRDYHSIIGLIPCDGIRSRYTSKALIYAFQFEEGISKPNGVFGPSTTSLCPTLSIGSSKKKFVYILQYALYYNGYDPNGFDGSFGNGVKNAVISFQSFSCLLANGIVGLQTWASLLVSYGDKTRQGSACDCITRLTLEKAQILKDSGYEIVGRYLTKVPGGVDKNLTLEELNIIFNVGLKVFPIYQTSGNHAEYFNKSKGKIDAISAITAALKLGFKENTIIYFSVDFDVLPQDISNNIVPHFNSINEVFNSEIQNPKNYRIGVYSPRDVCTQLYNLGLSCSSFVGDMASGYNANIGHPLPKNWAFDQISTKTIGSGLTQIEIDNNICSPRGFGSNSVDINDDEIENKLLEKRANLIAQKVLSELKLDNKLGIMLTEATFGDELVLIDPTNSLTIIYSCGTYDALGDTNAMMSYDIRNGVSLPSQQDFIFDWIGDETNLRINMINEVGQLTRNIGVVVYIGNLKIGICKNSMHGIGLRIEVYEDLVQQNIGYTRNVYARFDIYPNVDNTTKSRIENSIENAYNVEVQNNIAYVLSTALALGIVFGAAILSSPEVTTVGLIVIILDNFDNFDFNNLN